MCCNLKGRLGRSGSEACQVQEQLWGPVGMHSGRYERGGQFRAGLQGSSKSCFAFSAKEN